MWQWGVRKHASFDACFSDSLNHIGGPPCPVALAPTLPPAVPTPLAAAPTPASAVPSALMAANEEEGLGAIAGLLA